MEFSHVSLKQVHSDAVTGINKRRGHPSCLLALAHVPLRATVCLGAVIDSRFVFFPHAPNQPFNTISKQQQWNMSPPKKCEALLSKAAPLNLQILITPTSPLCSLKSLRWEIGSKMGVRE